MAAKMMRALVLVGLSLEGLAYRPYQVVDFPLAVGKSLAEAGMVDPDKNAVAYGMSLEGARVLVHEDAATVANAKAIAAAQSEVERLTAAVDGEADAAAKAVLADQLKAAQDALVALQG